MRINYFFVFSILVVVASIFTQSIAILVMSAIMMVMTAFFLKNHHPQEVRLYLIVFAVAVGFMLLVHYANIQAYDVPYYKSGSDDLQFERDALKAMLNDTYMPNQLLGTVLDQFHNASIYVTYIALIMKFATWFDGYSTFLPKMMNVFFLLWLTMLISYILRKYVYFTDKKILWFIALFAMTPNILYINSHVFRDTLNMLQIMLIVFCIDKLFVKKWGILQVIILLCMPVLIFTTFYLRENSLVFAAIMSILILLRKLNIRYFYIILLNIPLLIFTSFLEQIRFQYFFEKYSEYQTIISSGLSNLIFEQPLFPFGVFLRFGYAFISPFPNFPGLFRVVDQAGLDWIYFFIYLFVVVQILCIPWMFKRLLTIDWLTLSFIFLLFGVILTTFTFRHVIFYYPFMVALAVDGYTRVKPDQRWISVLLMLTAIVGMFFLYVQLKS
jgi:hypothetical protein